MFNIFKTGFDPGKDYLEKAKDMTGSGLALKRNSKTKQSQSEAERRMVKDIFTEEKKKKK